SPQPRSGLNISVNKLMDIPAQCHITFFPSPEIGEISRLLRISRPPPPGRPPNRFASLGVILIQTCGLSPLLNTGFCR
ncbi:MAG: hypothetical protein LBR97_07940, partial [Dysgonamonadaceae bacterium]|nr:hypothetical protein [Dysgonamonadaceae bacterium]